MNLPEEIKGASTETRVAARLAVAFTLLEIAPFTGSLDGPADEVAVYVARASAQRGNLGKIAHALGVYR